MRARLIALFAAVAGPVSCAPPGDLVAPGANQEPATSPSFFTAAVEHLARDAGRQVLVDPRPLRPGANLSGIDDEDLLLGAAEITRVRSEVIATLGMTQTDATVDQRCTFSEQGWRPPEWDAALPDSILRRRAECQARRPYTSFIISIPMPVTAEGYPPGTWRVRVHAMQKSGFEIWDLYLYARRPGEWEVFASEEKFSIWS